MPSAAERAYARLAIAGAVVVVGLLGWWIYVRFIARKPPPPPPPAVPVTAVVATARDVPALVPALGTVLSMDVVEVMPEVTGRITRIYFKQGQEVEAGQKLFEIDPRPYQAALEQAQGQLARDRASLAEAVMDLARYRKLASQNSIQRQTAEDQAYVVGQDRGTVALDQGNVAAARVNLDYCQITSPVTGRTGVIQVGLGNFVQPASAAAQAASTNSSSSNGGSPAGSSSGTAGSGSGGSASGSTALVAVTQMEPIFVSFNVPENQLATVLENQAKGPLTVAAYTAGGQLLATGTLSLINNQVDTTTGTILLEATFANRQQRLWPNQFVSVELTEFVRKSAVTVPAVAAMTGPDGEYVYVIGSDHKVKRVPVTVDSNQQGIAVIGKGLTAGEEVVTNGQYRLDDETLVSIQQPASATPGQSSAAVSAPSASTGAAAGQ
ncbi:MAG TPA: efflux RND transporter periplasmic adaptor subunit [Steroidobacteraceae bacterium]|jgi:multidrug efflux system membrane fusion protein|nr:efflux RND transporter periplasmic adaptor subunit [Steroidobacteraceae bacterium]